MEEEQSRKSLLITFLGWCALLILHVGFIFYKVLLSMTLWNLYIAEYVFEVSYWQMFLINFLFITMFRGTRMADEMNYKLKMILVEKHNLKLEGQFKITTLTYAKLTIPFIILYIIYTLI